jgi:hypothetical protein
MFSNYRSYYNKEPEQRCTTDHRIKNNPLSSLENKQRSFSRVVGPYTLSNLCQRLYAKHLGKIRLLKGNLI